MKKTYNPEPIDTINVILPPELSALVEDIAKNTHDNWSIRRIKEGWTYGERRDDLKKQTPCLVPYELLPESEKEYDRNISVEILKVIIKMGFKISR